MKHEFEYISYPEKERRAMLENSGAELERMLSRQASRRSGRRESRRESRARADEAGYTAPRYGGPGHPAPARGGAARRRWESGEPDRYSPRHGWESDYDDADADYDEDPDDGGDDYPDGDGYADGDGYESDDEADARDEEDAGYRGADGGYPGYADGGYYGGAGSGYSGADGRYRGADAGYRGPGAGYRGGGGGPRGRAVFHPAGPPGYGAGIAGAEADGYGAGSGAQEPDDRTEVLINRGRRHARQTGISRVRAHWRAIGGAIGGVAILSFVLAMILPGGDATWPASVAVVQKEIAVACENPNVVSEPSQVNFACAKDTRAILWVFSLLTSGDNPNYSDAANGRKGLEPITPAQGGSVAWSLNVHHPYDPANPVDSLEVAARAINNIIGGATVTGGNGAAVVQPGLESTGANCARYTGSSSLVTRQGFPAVCAQPVASPGGQAALVSDVFQQWMVGTPATVATAAGVLFENADNPGDPRVQAILKSLPQTGL